MLSTMQEFPLTITTLFRHGARIHRRSKVLTFDGSSTTEATFAQVLTRVERLAGALHRLGIGEGDVVGTFMWNNQEHLEAYFAVPCMGAVLHTLNIRLFPEQMAYIINQARDKVILVNSSVLPMLARVAADLETVEHFVVVDDGPTDEQALGSLRSVKRYEELLAAAEPLVEWPELDELCAAGMCYSSGTTGDPKGVVYSHRSTFLHAFGYNNASNLNLSERDRAVIIVPMFHVNAWGWPYVGWMCGADLVMPGRFLQGEPLVKLFEMTRATVSAGVPTIWNDVLRYLNAHPGQDLSSLRGLVCGGSALPGAIVDGFDKLGIRMLQGWGMTETSPVCTVSEPPGDADPWDREWRLRTGRVIPGVELRIVTTDGGEAPWDGETTGEVEVRGPWIAASYYGDSAPDKFHDGWLRTGDAGRMDDHGFLQITDRIKDVIKSGGEWISSLALEDAIMAHPTVAEAAVIGVEDEQWGERPLAIVVLREEAHASAEELTGWLEGRVAKWWIPERWTFVDTVPKTSVGKFDKKVLRAREISGELDIQLLAD